MGYMAFDQKEKEYRAEVQRLDDIAVNVVHSGHGDFLKTLSSAWLRANRSNKRILKPAWTAIVTKYSLAEEFED